MFDDEDKALRAMARGIRKQQESLDADAKRVRVLEDRLREQAHALRCEKEALVIALCERHGLFTAGPEEIFEAMDRAGHELRNSKRKMAEDGCASHQCDPRSTDRPVSPNSVDRCFATIHGYTNPTIEIKMDLKSFGLTKNGRKGVWTGELDRDAASRLQKRFGRRVTIENFAALDVAKDFAAPVDESRPIASGAEIVIPSVPERAADIQRPADPGLRAVFGVSERASRATEEKNVEAPSDIPEATKSEALTLSVAIIAKEGESTTPHGHEVDVDPPTPSEGDRSGVDCRSESSAPDAIVESEAAAGSSADVSPSGHRGSPFRSASWARNRANPTEAGQVAAASLLESDPSITAEANGPS
jgi:hypothetical protein